MIRIDNITAIVLCGGLGTRLRSVSGDLPKPMVDVAGRPFLEYVLDYLIEQGVKSVILAVSYQAHSISAHFGDAYRGLSVHYSREPTPMGTGGAIKFAIENEAPTSYQAVLVINGDTLVEYSLSDMVSKLSQPDTDLVMSLTNMKDTSRYGRVKLQDGLICSFEEKRSGQSGYINSGVYLFREGFKTQFPNTSAFSFETDVLEQFIHTHRVRPSISSGYFIDIGIPDDYQKAQLDFAASVQPSLT